MRSYAIKNLSFPRSTAPRVAVIFVFLALIFVAVFSLDDSDYRIIAAAFVLPVIVSINIWGFKRAIPILLLVPILNESASIADSWYTGAEIFSDPDLRIHTVASFAILFVGISYARVLKTSRTLKGELAFRRVIEKRESLRSSRLAILAELSREIGSIENSARMKSQIVSFMQRAGGPDNVTLYECIDRLGAWVDVAQSSSLIDSSVDSQRPSIAFGKFPEIESMSAPIWISQHPTNRTQSLESERTFIVPIWWQEKMIAFAALSYVNAPEPDQQQEDLLKEVARQINGSLAGSRVYLDAVNVAYRLEREATYRDRMIGVVSHEMNTPLTVAVALNDVMLHNREGNLSERQVNHLRVIRRNLQRIISVSRDTSVSSRIRQDALDLHTKPINLTSLLNETVESFRSVIDGLGQITQIEQPDEADYVVADRERFSQAINNILSNASKFSRSGQTIHVRLISRVNVARIEISDNGPGISADDLEDVFDWAYKSDLEQSVGKQGAGIGLFVAKAIVEAHGGTIGIESTRGVETKVWIEVPTVAAPTADAPEQAGAAGGSDLDRRQGLPSGFVIGVDHVHESTPFD